MDKIERIMRRLAVIGGSYPGKYTNLLSVGLVFIVAMILSIVGNFRNRKIEK